MDLSLDPHGAPPPGAFCWLDLAARDAARAMAFYAQAFGWRFETRHANGGTFTLCRIGTRDVGSLYPLPRARPGDDTPSHWTPYLRVDDVDATARRVAALGGHVRVVPFDVDGIARIALIEDAVGATLGLWQPLASAAGLGTMDP